MKFTTSLSAVLLSGGLTYASSLAVYQDNTFYNFTPNNNVIGFSKELKQNVRAQRCHSLLSPVVLRMIDYVNF